MSKGPELLFHNYYKCSECGEEWEDEWDCTCNDRCPNCDTEIEPFKSEDLPLCEDPKVEICSECPDKATCKLLTVEEK